MGNGVVVRGSSDRNTTIKIETKNPRSLDFRGIFQFGLKIFIM